MSRPSLGPRCVLAVLGLFLLAAPAPAADDDFDFAQALAARGYVDLAEETYEALVDNPRASASEKAEGQLGLALLKFGQARIAAAVTRDQFRKKFEEVVALFEAADAEIAAFITKNARHGRVLDAKLQRAKLLQARAEYVKVALDKGWVPSDVNVDELRKQLADGFDTAISMLEAVEKKARSDVAAAGKDEDKRELAEWELGRVWLNRLIAMLGKGAALPKGNAAGEAALTQALSEINEDYLWEYEGRILGIWANYYAARICKELDDPKEAIDFMLTAAQYAQEAPDTNREVWNVTFTSYVGLADLALEFADREGDWVRRALQAFEKMPQVWPSHLKIDYGQRGVLAWARLIQHDGRAAEALEKVNEVIQAAKRHGTNVDREAGDVLAGLMNAGGGSAAAVDPSLLARVARSKFRQAEFAACIQANQAVIRACTTKAQMTEHGWDAWEQIANCYGQQRRYYASYLALDAIWQGWLADRGNKDLDEMTDEVGYLRAQLLQLVARETKDEADKAAAKKAQQAFAAMKPNAPRNLGAAEGDAISKVREARILVRKDPEAGKAKAREALKALQGVDKTSLLYERVEATFAECHLIMGDYKKALEMARAWLAKKRPVVHDPTAKRARIEGKSLSISIIVQAHVRMAEDAEGEARKAAYQGVLDALDQYEQDFLQAAQGATILITQWRAEALIATGRIDLAETLVWQFVQAEPDHPNARFLAGTMAREVEADADSWQAKGDEDRFAQTMLRAAKLREFVLDHIETREPKVVVFVGESFQKGRDYETAGKYYAEALDIYRQLYEAEKDEKKREALQQSLASVRIQQIGLLIDQEKFDEAIPLLEERLVADPKDRAEVIATLQSGTGKITTATLPKLLEKMSKNKGVISELSRAWFKAKTKDRLLGCINLCDILLYATPKDERHDTVEYVKTRIRKLEAYYQYGLDFNQPNAFDHVISGVQNGIVTPGYEERYEQLVKGSKKRLQELLRSAKSKRGKN